MSEFEFKNIEDDVDGLIVNEANANGETDESGLNEEPIEETTEEETVSQRVILPKDINFIPKPLSLDNILKRIKRGKINFFTEYQRLPNLWDDVKKSRFIESILLRLPLPVFYFYGHEDEGIWEVIDGLQRLSAIKEFVIEKKLVLTNLEYLKNLQGLTFDLLPADLQIRIEEATITAYIITQNTPEEVKYTLFRRINTAALTLTPQEIRHALNQGTPAEFLKELANERSFKKATCGKIPKKRMGDRDFINRFIAFFVKDYEAYKPDLDTFLNDGLAEIKRKSKPQLNQIKTDFNKSMNYAAEIFGNDAFRKRYHISDDRKPLNKALFDVWSYYFAKYPEEQLKILLNRRNLLKEKFIKLMNQTRFNRSVSSATGDPDNVKHRFTEIGKIIRETLETV